MEGQGGKRHEVKQKHKRWDNTDEGGDMKERGEEGEEMAGNEILSERQTRWRKLRK